MDAETGLSWALPQQNQDRAVFPRFYVEPEQDPVASKAEGRPIYKDREFVEIRVAGDPKNVIVKKVDDGHRKRWPDFYAKFKQGLEQAPEGTPLEQWPILSRGRVLELKALGILTVEQLGAVSEEALPRMGMGSRQLREQAKAYVEIAKGNAPLQALAAENATLKEDLAALRAQFNDLAQRTNALLAKQAAA